MKNVGMNLKELQDSYDNEDDDEENEIDSPKVVINVWFEIDLLHKKRIWLI